MCHMRIVYNMHLYVEWDVDIFVAKQIWDKIDINNFLLGEVFDVVMIYD